MSLYTQAHELTFYLLYSIVFGFCTGIFYEFFRLIRIALPHSKTIIFIEDFIYSAIAVLLYGVFVFCSATLCSAGTVRWFSVFGSVLGFIIYFLTLGKLVFKLSDKIIGLIKKILKTVTKIMFYPLKKIANRVILLSKKLKNRHAEYSRAKKERKMLEAVVKSAGRGFQKG